MQVTACNLDQIVGQTLIDFEQNTAKGSASGSDEVILHFSGGGEILIFVHDEEGVKVEGD
jgi:hypothetical protein